MRRFAQLTVFLWIVAVASAADSQRWVQVAGGLWQPSPATLSELEAALKPAVASAARNRGRLPLWSDYTFQFQGRTTLLGRRYVYVNAFCGHEGGNLREDWVRVLDGGACYFSAKYDPNRKLVYDVEVNGVA
jgi:hypothetical protein